jgi:hypothetical protein
MNEDGVLAFLLGPVTTRTESYEHRATLYGGCVQVSSDKYKVMEGRLAQGPSALLRLPTCTAAERSSGAKQWPI